MKNESKMPALGKNIASIRKEKNLSLDELSKRSGVSKGMLSQVEQEKVNPTVAVVWKISYGLDVPFQELLQSGKSEQLFNHLHKNEAVILERDDGRCIFRILSPLYLAEKLEVYTLELKKGGSVVSEAHLEGTEEFLSVASGKVSVEAKAKKAVLEQGDSIHYQVDVRHVIRNLSGGASSLYLVVRYKAAGSSD
ncbi:MAG: helix-turn-helix transcriptional regulator [Candidatus Glassbacteria bacterium]|nr:helix-turn-helix transcriptional regulator [Candidatus Glassbacteria bacterium]